MSLSESIVAMRNMLQQAEAEIKNLEGGRKASSAKARKQLQSIKMASHSLRKAISEHSNSLPTKPRVKKTVTIAEPVEAESIPEPEPVKATKSKPRASKKAVTSTSS
jgi:small-conductance mechanosensitive channel